MPLLSSFFHLHCFYYFYHDDANPSISIHWQDAAGNELSPFLTSETVQTVRLRKPDDSSIDAFASGGSAGYDFLC